MIRTACQILLVALLAAACSGDDTDPGAVDRSPDPTTTTTTAPPRFPPIPTEGDVVAVRTPTGVLVPTIGAAEGKWIVNTPCAQTAHVQGAVLYGAHVVLDPGHGGSEPGAVSPLGMTEKDINLDIAHRVAERLRAEGMVVVMTRNADIRVTLATRGALARALDPLAFVSIHHNASPEATAPSPAPEIYHQLADPESKRLAGLVWEELVAALAPFGTSWSVGEFSGAFARQSETTGDDFYGVLRHSQGVPAALVEGMYLSEQFEAELLTRADVRDAEAEAIARAILRLVETNDPGSGYRPTHVSSVPAGGGGGSAGCVDPPLT